MFFALTTLWHGSAGYDFLLGLILGLTARVIIVTVHRFVLPGSMEKYLLFNSPDGCFPSVFGYGKEKSTWDERRSFPRPLCGFVQLQVDVS